MPARFGRHRTRSLLAALLVPALALSAITGCSSISVERTGEESGTFRSSATAFVFLGWESPAPAMETARANAADSGRRNLLIEEESIFPYLGWFDWLLDIIGVRYAVVRGTWGEPEDG